MTFIARLTGDATRWAYGAAYLPLVLEWNRRVFGLWHAAQIAGRVPAQYIPLALRRLGARVGERAFFKPGLRIENATGSLSNLQIGDNCHLGSDVFFDLTGPVEIGSDVALAARVAVVTHLSAGNRPLRQWYPDQVRGVVIGDGVLVGTGAILLSGVHVGRYGVVAAGAVVTMDVPEYTVVGGNPARPVRKLGPIGPTVGARPDREVVP